MTIVWIALTGAFVLAEIGLAKAARRRSAWFTLGGDRIALSIGATWCAVAAAVSWADDDDLLGGLLFGGLTGTVMARAAAAARRRLAQRRTDTPR